jgi:predicted RNase H-like HicB family nuclease
LLYSIVLEPDSEDRGFTVHVPALPGCITEGATRDEAIANAKEAIEGFIEALLKPDNHRPLTPRT